MECLIAVGLGDGYPVAQTVGVGTIEVGEGGVDAIAHLLLVDPLRGVEDDAHGVEVVDLLEGDLLGLHLAPDGVDAFDACLGFVFETHGVEALAYGGGEVVVDHGAPLFGALQEGGYALVFGWVLVLEREVFELGLDGEESEAMGEGGVDVEGLAGDLELLVGSHGAEGAHVVEAVGHLDEHDADVAAHGEEELAEVFGLGRGFVAEDASGNLGEPRHEFGDFLAEVLLDVLDGVFGVLDYIMEERRANGC